MKLLLIRRKNKQAIEIKWLAITVALLSCCAAPAIAEDWSDNSISWRYGDKFREPFNNQDISKSIFSLTHADGYKYGSNFLNIDELISDSRDPSSATSNAGALETYIVFRTTLDIGKVTNREIKFTAVRGRPASLLLRDTI